MDSTLSWGLLVMKMGLILWLFYVKNNIGFFGFLHRNRTEPKPVGWNQVQFGFSFFLYKFFFSVWLFL
jgi:hypothetical protein